MPATCHHSSGWVQDVKYVEDKLKDLMNIAEDGIGAIDRQVRDLEYNISRLEEENEDEMSEVCTSLPCCNTCGISMQPCSAMFFSGCNAGPSG